MAVDKTRCSGTKTEAGFRNWVIQLLRRGSLRWRPRTDALARQRTAKGIYLCEGCEEEVPTTLPPTEEGGKRIKNVFVDHIRSVVDPDVGFVGYDTYIDRLFVEADGLQVLCSSCHSTKTNEEKQIARERRKNG